MKFDPLNWSEVTAGETYENTQGLVHVRSDAPCVVYVESEGVEAIAGVGLEVRAKVSPQGVRVRVEGQGRIFAYMPIIPTLSPKGESFVNLDRKVGESGAVAEVTKAMRQFALQQRAFRREMEAERQRLIAAGRYRYEGDAKPRRKAAEDVAADEADAQEPEPDAAS